MKSVFKKLHDLDILPETVADVVGAHERSREAEMQWLVRRAEAVRLYGEDKRRSSVSRITTPTFSSQVLLIAPLDPH